MFNMRIARFAIRARGRVGRHVPGRSALLLACFLVQIDPALGLGFEHLEPAAPPLDPRCHRAEALSAA